MTSLRKTEHSTSKNEKVPCKKFSSKKRQQKLRNIAYSNHVSKFFETLAVEQKDLTDSFYDATIQTEKRVISIGETLFSLFRKDKLKNTEAKKTNLINPISLLDFESVRNETYNVPKMIRQSNPVLPPCQSNPVLPPCQSNPVLPPCQSNPVLPPSSNVIPIANDINDVEESFDDSFIIINIKDINNMN
jgi:hypothetical protein